MQVYTTKLLHMWYIFNSNQIHKYQLVYSSRERGVSHSVYYAVDHPWHEFMTFSGANSLV